MTEEHYNRIHGWFLARPSLLRLLKFLNTWLTRTVYCVYPLLVAVLSLRKDVRVIRVLAVPAGVFFLVTAMRRLWNRPRPYEAMDIEPLIPREKKGCSFPSRHAASAAVIAFAFWYVSPPLGAVLSAVALAIAVIRPLGGIHYPRDTAAGVVISLCLGFIGFYVI